LKCTLEEKEMMQDSQLNIKQQINQDVFQRFTNS